MKNRRQQLVLSNDLKATYEHGGSLAKGRRKTKRPIATKKAMHVTLRSSWAKGELSLLQRRNASFLKTLLPELAKRWEVRVYRWSNNGNHLHLLVKARRRKGFQNFLRVLAG